MSLFSSDRERRLWAWTLAVVVAIYSTLGLAQKLAGILREEGLLTHAFWLSLLLMASAIIIQGLKRRPGGAEIGVALGIAGAYLLLFLRMWTPAERTHLMEYTVVVLLIYEALSERASNGRPVPLLPLLAFLATALVGVIDEVIQWFLPSRVFEWIDILFNTLAAFMAVLACVALGWARRLTIRLRQRSKKLGSSEP